MDAGQGGLAHLVLPSGERIAVEVTLGIPVASLRRFAAALVQIADDAERAAHIETPTGPPLEGTRPLPLETREG